jgi:translation elongation factor EF-Ts
MTVMSNPAASSKKAASPLGTLRKKSGYSFSLCKKALAANDQDVDKAFKWLQVLAKVEQ